ncbi:MAG: hypothetical protein ACOXZZ_03410 [Sphaerochaetaceae bacterium]|jgi:hypothetical protein
MNNSFSEIVTDFHGSYLPERGMLAGYAALIKAFNLKVPPLHTNFVIGTKHKVFQTNNWNYLTPRHTPNLSLKGELEFALKYEGVNLCVLLKLY